MSTPFNDQQKLLFTSDRTIVLWFLWILSLLVLLIVAGLASLLPPEEMIRSFGSIRVGRIFQTVLIVGGSVFIWPMLWLSSRYVIRVELLQANQFVIKTWTIFGIRSKVWSLADWEKSTRKFHHGKFELDDRKVNAPYTTVRAASGKKMIIDMQGDFPYGEDALMEVLAPAGEI